jgi:hypothetical protein
MSRHALRHGGSLLHACNVYGSFEVARVLVRLEHVASFIVDATDGIM